MDLLYLQPSVTKPEIRLNAESKTLSLSGRSSPENALMFYQRVLDSLDRYFDAEVELTANFQFDYFNTSSSKCLFLIFKKLKKQIDLGKRVELNWYYEEDDDDMLETGEDFADLMDLDINMIEVSLDEEDEDDDDDFSYLRA